MDIPGLFGLTTTTIDSVLIPTKVRSVKSRIMDIAMGPNHTVLLTDDGKVVTMGHNKDAQLGRGNSRSYTRSQCYVLTKFLPDFYLNQFGGL